MASEGPRQKKGPNDEPKKSGFEYDGVFVPWHLTDKIIDLQMVDHFAKMPPADFFACVEDDWDRERTPILSAMMATSLRQFYPNWSSSRVVRFVEDINMSGVVFFEGEKDEEDEPDPTNLDTPSEDEEGTKDSKKK